MYLIALIGVKNMKKSGFTLFEILTTLAIIGIIAAMTVPAMMDNHQKTAFTTSLHKFYDDLTYAIENYMSEQHIDDLSEADIAGSAANLRNFVNTYFKVQENCGTTYSNSSGNACFARYYRNMSTGNRIDASGRQCNVVFRTTNGIAVCLNSAEMTSSSFSNDDGYAITADIDTNGPNDPNVIGKDLIQGIAVNNTGNIVPKGTSADDEGYYFNRIIEAGWKMDY